MSPSTVIADQSAAVEPLVRLDEVHKRFGATRAVDRTSLEIRGDEVLVLLGPTGCGKTTLLRMIAGLEQPDGGRIAIDGRDARRLAPHQRDLAMVFQQDSLYPHLTIAGNLDFARQGRLRRLDEADIDIKEVAQWCEIDELLQRRPHELSGGQRQRAALARALVRESRLLLLDEPFSNVDSRARRRLREGLLRWRAARGATLAWVTHDQDEAMAVADRMACLHQGRILQVDSPSELYHRPRSLHVAQALGSPPMNVLAIAPLNGRQNIQSLETADWTETVVGPWRFARRPWPSERPRVPLVAALRPSAISVNRIDLSQGSSPPSTAASASAHGRVARVEDYGDRCVLQLEIGEVSLLAVDDSGGDFRHGETVAAQAKWDDLLWFDAEHGERVEGI